MLQARTCHRGYLISIAISFSDTADIRLKGGKGASLSSYSGWSLLRQFLMNNNIIIMEKFKQHNIKATPQRLAIYNLLINTKSHPSADMLYKSLHDRYPTMSLATVYKTIDILKKADLVQELVDDAFVTRYDANTHPHPHIICLSCNRIDDLNIDIPTDDTILKAASNATDYSIEFIRLYFYGYCSNCQNRMKNK